MSIRIDPISLGLDQCYIIRGEKAIMVDGGSPKQGKKFLSSLQRLSIKPQDIQLIVLTHGHWDHIGTAKEIKALTGAKIALHYRERDCLEKSLKPLIPGVTIGGKIFVIAMKTMMPLVDMLIQIPPTNVDIVLEDEGFSLSEYGIPGRILYTPGHSIGSVSVLLDTGDAFVGDLAMSGFPMRLTPGLPPIAEDMQKVKESWKLLINAGAKTIYPAHMKPFSVDLIQRALL